MSVCKRRRGGYLHLFVGEAATLHSFYISSTELRITSLFVQEEFRGQGLATKLLKRAIYEARRNSCSIVTLDDFSDTGRVYLKMGFRYVEEPYPEMVYCIGTHLP